MTTQTPRTILNKSTMALACGEAGLNAATTFIFIGDLPRHETGQFPQSLASNLRATMGRSPNELGSKARLRRCQVKFGGILGDVPHEIAARLTVLFQNEEIRIREAALMTRQYEFEILIHAPGGRPEG